MSTFDIKKFLINEGMTRVSRDRKRLLKESEDSNDWVDNASYDEMVDWIVEYLGDIALSLGYDWDPSRDLRFESDNGWWFEAEEGPTEDSPFTDIWLPEDESDPESDATLLKYYENDVEALRTLIKNVDWDTLTVTDEIAKGLKRTMDERLSDVSTETRKIYTDDMYPTSLGNNFYTDDQELWDYLKVKYKGTRPSSKAFETIDDDTYYYTRHLPLSREHGWPEAFYFKNKDGRSIGIAYTSRKLYK